MEIKDFNTKEINTWCPGCTNFMILQTVKEALTDLVNAKTIKSENIAIATGIGCHAKLFDYLNVNGFYGLHGRVLPLCLGMKLANPDLTVIGFGGDGDTYAEGISHLVHNCRYNADFTMIVHNNQVFALTTGQATPTSEIGFVDGSTPLGVKEKPLNPIAFALVCGATFVARAYASDAQHLKLILKEAILHRGFALVDIIQPCLTFHNLTPFFEKHIYKLDENHNTQNLGMALERAKEWDYTLDDNAKIPIGIFYQIKKATFEEGWPQLKQPWFRVDREIDWKKTLEEFKANY